ncbi:MAG: hypothetical protein DMG60_13685 [Acidobacteria bacterium]|nr:MAG: hypothetical protein DMG60_13685 [Acidobacteriota bacterium]
MTISPPVRPPTANLPAVTRRTFLKRASLLAGTAGLGLAGYSSFIEPNEIDLRHVEIKIERLPPAFEGFKIAILSDLHFGPYTGEREIGAAIEATNQLRPDMVALLGDFVSEPLVGDKKTAARKAEPCAQLLARLRSRLGSFAVLGNHDVFTDPDFVSGALKAHGVSLLQNSHQAIEQGGDRLWLLGTNDALLSNCDLDAAAAGIPSQETKILLAHEPDIADHSAKLGIDVQLSGHSHGGQVRAPGLPPLYLPPLGSRYYEGYYRIGGLQLYTNRGIGTVGLPFRFLCPPEVTLVTLRAA